MLKDLIAWRKAENNEADRIRGYNYAAGQLLKGGTDMFIKLEDECANVFDHNWFDRGMREALHDYNAQFMRLLAS